MASSAASQSSIKYERNDQQRPIPQAFGGNKSARNNKELVGVNSRKLSVNDFQLIKTLGTGTFARVWLVKLRNAIEADRNKVFALKVLRKVEGSFGILNIVNTYANTDSSGQIKTSRPCKPRTFSPGRRCWTPLYNIFNYILLRPRFLIHAGSSSPKLIMTTKLTTLELVAGLLPRRRSIFLFTERKTIRRKHLKILCC